MKIVLNRKGESLRAGKVPSLYTAEFHGSGPLLVNEAFV
jgi:hypothetical protein